VVGLKKIGVVRDSSKFKLEKIEFFRKFRGLFRQ
jgi:hypothetical protein